MGVAHYAAHGVDYPEDAVSTCSLRSTDPAVVRSWPKPSGVTGPPFEGARSTRPRRRWSMRVRTDAYNDVVAIL